MDCIFCKIASKEAEAEILYENEEVISFLDVNPMNYGHALVIPKKHYTDFLAVPVSELNSIIKVVHNVSGAIKNSLKPDGINLIANNGIAAGQSVFHFHFHIIPRFSDDEFKFRINLKKYKNGLLKEFGDKIRLEISK
ncbi:MAG: HIT family protein [Ignavibacteriaceae bacterium]